ncbi:MAG: PLD nuclease N-terminal domain-containing protein [Candidatus Peribacteraceae bacterium]
MDSLSLLVENASAFFSSNPSVFLVQLGMLAVALFAVFLVLFTTRDILLRTHSLLYQIACILLVSVLPGIGFLLYLLVRPGLTNAQRKMQEDLDWIMARFNTQSQKQKKVAGSK